MQKIRNSSVLAMDLRLFCIKPSIQTSIVKVHTISTVAKA